MKRLNSLAAAATLAGLAAIVMMPAPTFAQKAPVDYIIGPSDVLGISVFGQEKLSSKYSVSSDGTFEFPYIGRVKAGGLTARAVETDIRDRLAKDLFTNPQVSVVVDQFRSQSVYVLGQVRNPQTLQFTGSLTLIDAIARAGGLTDRAGPEVLVARGSAGGVATPTGSDNAGKPLSGNDPNVVRISIEKLQAGDYSQNISLTSGYIVSVPEAEKVFVEGQVGRTGEYAIRPGMTVRQVIALAGGITDLGSDTRVEITRKMDGKSVVMKNVKLEEVVRNGDMIKVPKRWF